MLDGIALQNGHGHTKSDTVVGSQRSAAGLHPSILDVRFYRVAQRIKGLAFFRHAYHIHMGVHHGDGCLLHSRCSWFADDDAVVVIALIVEMMLFGKLTEPVGYLLFMP